MHSQFPINLRAKRIRRSFGSGAILADVTLDLGSGTLTLLTGRNGSGKTTLVNCLTGFDQDYEGEVYLENKSLRQKGPDERARLGIVRTFQYPHLFRTLTVREHLALGGAAAHSALFSYFRLRWRDVRNHDLLVALELEKLSDRRGNQLSFGEMKLVNTARAFMTGARVFLLDEPLASLHGRKREIMLEAIIEKRRMGCAILVIEHEIPELLKLADVAYELREGQLFLINQV